MLRVKGKTYLFNFSWLKRVWWQPLVVTLFFCYFFRGQDVVVYIIYTFVVVGKDLLGEEREKGENFIKNRVKSLKIASFLVINAKKNRGGGA